MGCSKGWANIEGKMQAIIKQKDADQSNGSPIGGGNLLSLTHVF